MSRFKCSTGSTALRSALLLCVAGLMGNTSCSEPLNKDGLFEVWCGDTLCEWTVDSGEIKRVPTWHPDDSGVALIGAQAAISQRSEKRFDCFEVVLLSDIEAGTEVVFEMDFGDDGAFEYSQPIDGRDWQQLEYKITPPSGYNVVRIRVRKLNPGRAVLGRIAIFRGQDCQLEPLTYNNRPTNTPCEVDSECASGACGTTIYACSGLGLFTLCDPDASTCGEQIEGSACQAVPDVPWCQ